MGNYLAGSEQDIKIWVDRFVAVLGEDSEIAVATDQLIRDIYRIVGVPVMPNGGTKHEIEVAENRMKLGEDAPTSTSPRSTRSRYLKLGGTIVSLQGIRYVTVSDGHPAHYVINISYKGGSVVAKFESRSERDVAFDNLYRLLIR